MAILGKTSAVAQTKQFSMSGFIAWILWLFIHLYYLIGFRNKAFVMFQWAWSFFTSTSGARLIINYERDRNQNLPGTKVL